jgi:hypothetical protein
MPARGDELDSLAPSRLKPVIPVLRPASMQSGYCPRIFSTIIVVELFSTNPSTFTVPP